MTFQILLNNRKNINKSSTNWKTESSWKNFGIKITQIFTRKRNVTPMPISQNCIAHCTHIFCTYMYQGGRLGGSGWPLSNSLWYENIRKWKSVPRVPAPVRNRTNHARPFEPTNNLLTIIFFKYFITILGQF